MRRAGSLFDVSLYWLVRPLMGRTRRVLRPVLGRDVRAHLRRTRQLFMEEAAGLAAQPTLGASVMVRLAALTVASYRSLRMAGLDEAEARRLAAASNWAVYEVLTGPTWLLTALLGRDRVRRVKRTMDLYMRFPYAKPGYVMDWVVLDDDVVGFDVQHCPAADYFLGHKLAKLCTDAFCDLDVPLADIWGVRLQRDETIAKGCARCTFRYHRLTDSDSATLGH